MKKILLIPALFLCIIIQAQTPFEGKITYNITINGDISQNEKQNLPQEVTALFKDKKMRLNISTDKLDFHIIATEENEEAFFLMELKEDFPMKMAIKVTKSKLKEELNIDSPCSLNYTHQKKNIAGYQCKKVSATIDDGEYYAFVTESINAQGINWLFNEELKGTMLELVIRNKNNTEGLILKATAVNQTTIADTKFEIPADYMIISEEALKDMFDSDTTF